MIQAGTGNIYFCTNTRPDAAGTVFSLAERMHIAFSGNVGIGQGPTGCKLTAAGDIYANGSWLRTSDNAGRYSGG
jgi:hypothetical protein